jgi:hypothetical protein
MGFMIKHIGTGTYTAFPRRPYMIYLIAPPRRPFTSRSRGSARCSNFAASTILGGGALRLRIVGFHEPAFAGRDTLIEYTLSFRLSVENHGYRQLIGPAAAAGHVRHNLQSPTEQILFVRQRRRHV